ncbi:DUF4126 family protein [Euryarchaeota archaeon]|nr:DUF4126 family protein [Euryarchaeota archaeon]
MNFDDHDSLEGNTNIVFQWLLAIIAGGGVSGVIQGTTLATRTASTVMTTGLEIQ